MTETRAEQEARMRAHKAFQADERTRAAEQRVTDEEKRKADLSAKTARLRALREARDAAHREEKEVRKPKLKPSRPERPLA